jgi:hypothetical protein
MYSLIIYTSKKFKNVLEGCWRSQKYSFKYFNACILTYNINTCNLFDPRKGIKRWSLTYQSNMLLARLSMDWLADLIYSPRKGITASDWSPRGFFFDHHRNAQWCSFHLFFKTCPSIKRSWSSQGLDYIWQID